MINTWWLICNSKEMSHPNPLGNAVRVGDGKTDFLQALADWLEKWHDDCPAFTLTSKTSYSLVLTLRAQSGLIKELLSEGYDFVMTSRLQSDPIERRFWQYRQMSDGRFLISLREVTNSERIIRCRSLVKADINFWKEDLGSDKPSLDFSALLALLCLVSMKLKLLNRLLIRVAKKFPLLLRVTSPKNWQKGLIATVVNRYLLQVQWTWQKTITSTFFLVADSLSHLQNWLSILAIVLRSWITHTTSFKHTVSGMCGQHILKFLIGFLPRLTFVVQNITIGD